jgi:hypothetical protein
VSHFVLLRAFNLYLFFIITKHYLFLKHFQYSFSCVFFHWGDSLNCILLKWQNKNDWKHQSQKMGEIYTPEMQNLLELSKIIFQLGKGRWPIHKVCSKHVIHYCILINYYKFQEIVTKNKASNYMYLLVFFSYISINKILWMYL